MELKYVIPHEKRMIASADKLSLSSNISAPKMSSIVLIKK
jgi:hypothetical protein